MSGIIQAAILLSYLSLRLMRASILKQSLCPNNQKNVNNPTHTITPIQETIPEDRNFSFLWIPGYPGKREGRRASKATPRSNWASQKKKKTVDDCKVILHQHIKQRRQHTWDELGRELQIHIKPQLAPWTSSRQDSRHKKVMLTSLRTGRTAEDIH